MRLKMTRALPERTRPMRKSVMRMGVVSVEKYRRSDVRFRPTAKPLPMCRFASVLLPISFINSSNLSKVSLWGVIRFMALAFDAVKIIKRDPLKAFFRHYRTKRT